MLKSAKEVGSKGEKLATKFLKRKGYKIIQRNYSCKLGEIDIIAERDKTIIFVEVKARQTQEFGVPQYAITSTKKNQISKVALWYLKEKKQIERSCRFDVIAIMFTPESRKPEIEHIENAFPLVERYRY